MKKRTLSFTIFFVALLMLLGISYYALWTHDVLPDFLTPNQETTADDGNLYPALNGDGKWGYIDAAGKMVIEPQFETAEFFAGAAAWAQKDGKWAPVDRQGRALTDWIYLEHRALEDGGRGLVVASDGQTQSLFDADGRKLFGIDGELGAYDGGLIAFCRVKGAERLWGYIDSAGKIVIAPQYAEVGAVGASHALVRAADGRVLLVNRADGTELELPEGIGLYGLGSDRILDSRGQLYGYLDMQGQPVIEAQFAAAEPFSNNVALVADVNGKYGLIDENGGWILKPQYYNARSLGNNYYLFSDGLYDFALVNKKGETVCEHVVSSGEWLYGRLTLQTVEGTRFLNMNGELSEPIAYKAQCFRVGSLICVISSHGSYYYNTKGETVYATPGVELADGYALQSCERAEDAYLQLLYPMVVDKNGKEADTEYAAINRRLRNNALEDFDQTYLEADGSVNFMLSGDYSLSRCGSVLSVLQQNYVSEYELSPVYSSLCFDMASGRQYNLSALFVDNFNWRSDLTPYLAAAVADEPPYLLVTEQGEEIPDPEFLAVLNQRLERNTPFMLSATGLTLYISYMDGITPVEMSWQDLVPILDRNGALCEALNLGL